MLLLSSIGGTPFATLKALVIYYTKKQRKGEVRMLKKVIFWFRYVVFSQRKYCGGFCFCCGNYEKCKMEIKR